MRPDKEDDKNKLPWGTLEDKLQTSLTGRGTLQEMERIKEIQREGFKEIQREGFKETTNTTGQEGGLPTASSGWSVLFSSQIWAAKKTQRTCVAKILLNFRAKCLV